MRPWDRLSISTKITGLVLGVLAVAVAVLAWFSIVRQQELLEAGLRGRGEVLGRAVAAYCAGPLVFQDERAAGELLGQLQAANDVMGAMLLDGTGRKLAQWWRTERPSALPVNVLPDEGWVELAPGQLWSAYTVTFKGKAEGTLVLGVGDAGLRAARRDLALVVGGLALVLLALGAALGWALQRRITGPLVALATTMQGIREQRALHLRVPDDGRLDELGALCRAFNAMLEDLEKGQAQLQEMHKLEAVGQLAGGVAHDFNNLLTAIIGCAELLTAEQDPKERDALTREILQASARGAELIGQLLAFSRRRAAARVPVDLHQVVGQVAALARRTFDRRIELRQRLEAARAIVEGDPTQLESALLNLAVNARDALPAGGVITFATREVSVGAPDASGPAFSLAPGAYVELAVIDTGQGIPPDVLPRIFEPFFTTKDVGKGSGLGLAAVYGTAKSHGGSVAVTSTPGAGTAFKLLFPLASARAPAPREEAGEVPRGSGRLLVVDDEAAVRAATARMLRSLGFEVEQAGGAEEAIRLCGASAFDALVVDVMMPGMTGTDLVAHLRAQGLRTPCLLVSGFDLSGAAQTNPGGEPVLQKPYTVKELARKLHQVLHA